MIIEFRDKLISIDWEDGEPYATDMQGREILISDSHVQELKELEEMGE